MSSATETTASSGRMSSDQRREQILAAARRVFAEGGYGATTDEVARAAGVSQPYVVRLFGSKRELFAAAYQAATGEVLTALGAVPAGPDAERLMGQAYLSLIADRDLLRLLMHGFIAGTEDEVGRAARHCLGESFRLYSERTGATPDEARQFVAFGMLLNVLVAVDAEAHRGQDEGLDGLTDCVALTAQRVAE
ncbi:TetR/AcrR family transcriptional regulator [Cellulomonas sp.]|uniref:TetR/AcrR family transcriptional regulator n=1 Tax=Cellulomonas sp. TaxID=40001 RepID=UPI002582FDF5|nr:TetR/AcrR family transcriptional regulator [Cellulomonas sp.]MCR6689663.1 TetR/AcrR family transcriptional regulator [Cellulomonas sp.]